MRIDDIEKDLITAVKSRDRVKSEALRFLISEIRYSGIARYGAGWESDMTAADIAAVIQQQVKRHRESIDAYKSAGRDDLVSKETAELKILTAYQPQQIGDADLKKLLAEVAASGEKNFGLLMKQAMVGLAGKADGARVSAMLREILSGKAGVK
ncbi:hypothetical protein A2Z33_01495 [Candidatus Gottesmanbacteria bacterium RBG_16_52_11]|uniref:Glutamyl-tRNA amidotransferase n=1 Tax=Candidatus Gottesmanbacteria bacterium RBG_16_52_11 TaxID=1798374 RepID=A0A1F5YP41_9BACT|nr:MAG: hypothetical protein A2Z33_01495 [Candidatus Gottesmanbacteria bacterium RBG_16_52_11]